MKEKNASTYFDETPSSWGLRGDPFLWEELKSKFQKMNVPVSASELERLLHKFFKELIGEPPKRGNNIFVERYSKGGMASGMVSSDFWLEKGFATIVQQYIEMEMR